VEPVDHEEANSYTTSDNSKWVGDMPENAKSVVKSQKGFKVIDKDKD
jgi:hypothetical protein